MNPDIVYYVKKSSRNEELRYSLRSLENLPHNNVWVVGHRNRWFRNINFIPGNNGQGIWTRSLNNIHLAVDHPDISSNIIVMNDDFFIMNPVKSVVPYYNGTIDEHAQAPGAGRGYKRMATATSEYMQDNGFNNFTSYELHYPFPVHKDNLAVVVHELQEVNAWGFWRTIYGNKWKIGGEQREDCKIRTLNDKWEGDDFVSTNDTIFARGTIGEQIRRRFPEKSRYET